MKPLPRRHEMIFIKTFSSEIKTMSSSFMKSIYIYNIFYHLVQLEQIITEVWKKEKLWHCGVITIPIL